MLEWYRYTEKVQKPKAGSYQGFNIDISVSRIS